jgi:ssDNA-binding Zn-finger/Zn-ribbon topoisomerase 1
MNIIKACPQCGATLTERTNRETGEPFLGCSRYPDCKHTEPMPESIKLRRAGQRGMFDQEPTS